MKTLTFCSINAFNVTVTQSLFYLDLCVILMFAENEIQVRSDDVSSPAQQHWKNGMAFENLDWHLKN